MIPSTTHNIHISKDWSTKPIISENFKAAIDTHKDSISIFPDSLTIKLTAYERVKAAIIVFAKTIFSLGSSLFYQSIRDEWKSVFTGKQVVQVSSDNTDVNKTHKIAKTGLLNVSEDQDSEKSANEVQKEAIVTEVDEEIPVLDKLPAAPAPVIPKTVIRLPDDDSAPAAQELSSFIKEPKREISLLKTYRLKNDDAESAELFCRISTNINKVLIDAFESYLQNDPYLIETAKRFFAQKRSLFNVKENSLAVLQYAIENADFANLKFLVELGAKINISGLSTLLRINVKNAPDHVGNHLKTAIELKV